MIAALLMAAEYMGFGLARKAENPPHNHRKRLKNHNVVFRHRAPSAARRKTGLIWVNGAVLAGSASARQRRRESPQRRGAGRLQAPLSAAPKLDSGGSPGVAN
jgi:hypothetical protein